MDSGSLQPRLALAGAGVAALVLARWFLLWLLSPILAAQKRSRLTDPSEDTFVTPNRHDSGVSNKLTPFPTLKEAPTLLLSVIVPAYNEQDRLPHMLSLTLQYLEREASRDQDFTYEVLVVDDGSTDGTSKVR